jgi:glycosyltransferase involved in cell wall biosynthesis
MQSILYIVSTLKKSGPTNQLYNLLKYLNRGQFEPHLITLSPESDDSRWKDYIDLKINLHSLHFSRVTGLVMARSSLERLVDQIQPDLIHSQGIRSDILSAGLNVSVPRICTIRNIPQKDYLMSYGLLRSKLMVWQHVAAMRNLDVCVAVSEAVNINLRQTLSVKSKHVKTIENGVDTEVYKPVSAREKLLLRKLLSLPCQASLWISSGDLTDRKDPLFLINFWKLAFSQDSEQHLVFIGNGSLEAECRMIAKNYPNIHIVGRVANVIQYLQACDYFLSASKSEGLPNAVIEAMACGLPVLLSDIEPHKEIWKMATGAGALFNCGSQESFMLSLQTINNGDRLSMSRASIHLASSCLNANKMSQKYQSLYRELLDRK